ncbi:hypothetical protein [Rathayibacter sp. VKM Ac-2927]|uniref:hypothetical protein n=1 Tax=Rathayibacter sp. VKM Ac-2927 TaxID=2929478 RepID=UPI001FB2EAB1|nr:hypothetical protein [Rathayibacter sp. VKM Ac-2927]MCJ1688602.1 hypothetical protein [Rathayibacter sp. VKM Ac-2927]
MILKQDARALKTKALSSMKAAMVAFNSPQDDGRVTEILLRLQHSFEMLLKAALTQGGVRVFDIELGRSIGFEAAVRQSQQLASLMVTEDEAGTLRTIDALRDDEQHWFTEVSEGLLFLHTRAAVTLFDDLLHRAFGDRLADHLPLRVLPISVEPPQDFVTLVDREYEKIAELLRPGRRARSAARARLRALLAMESHVDPDAKVSQSDVKRVEKGIREGKTREQVFPKLGAVGAEVRGAGLEVEVRMVKHGGMPMTYTNDEDAAAIREVNLQKRYSISRQELADKLRLSTARTAALRAHLGLDSGEPYHHVFVFGSVKHPQYSGEAVSKMRAAMTRYDMDAIWRAHSTSRAADQRPPCDQPDCALSA